MAVLRYSGWRLDPTALPETAQVFPAPEGIVMESGLKMAPWLTWWKTLRSWTTGPSEVEGCVGISAATLVRQTLLAETKVAALLKTPLLILVHAVRMARWDVALRDAGLEDITSVEPALFAESQLKKKCKSYFICILTIRALWERGLTTLPHTGSAKFYLALLYAAKPNEVFLGQPPKVYDSILEKE